MLLSTSSTYTPHCQSRAHTSDGKEIKPRNASWALLRWRGAWASGKTTQYRRWDAALCNLYVQDVRVRSSSSLLSKWSPILFLLSALGPSQRCLICPPDSSTHRMAQRRARAVVPSLRRYQLRLHQMDSHGDGVMSFAMKAQACEEMDLGPTEDSRGQAWFHDRLSKLSVQVERKEGETSIKLISPPRRKRNAA